MVDDEYVERATLLECMAYMVDRNFFVEKEEVVEMEIDLEKTETVVEEPGSYPDCGQYLGDLFGGKTSKKSSSTTSESTITSNGSTSEASTDWDADDRYSY